MVKNNIIKLFNNKVIELKDKYGNVYDDDLEKQSHIFSLFNSFNKDGDNKLNSSEIKNIFDSLQEAALEDGNNELSEAELLSFLKKHIKNEYTLSMINSKDILKFLKEILNISEKQLKNADKVVIRNTFNDVFSEFSFLNLGKDNNIDYTKLSNEELKKHYPPDKYVIEETKNSLVITNKATGVQVLSKNIKSGSEGVFDLKITSETTGRTINLKYMSGNSLFIESDDNCSMYINNGKCVRAKSSTNDYRFDTDGVLSTKYTDKEQITYKNGKAVKKEENHFNDIVEQKVIDNSEKIEILIKSGNISELANLITESVRTNNIGIDMDNYYKKTGRELIDDIKNSNLSNDVKEKILNKICSPFIESEYYDADKIIENSQISNEYYISNDKYTIKYNGPIIIIENNTTGKVSRINLRTLLKDLEFSNKKELEESLKRIQSYPGEVLENIANEVDSIKELKAKDAKNEYDKKTAAGSYWSDSINAPYINDSIIHELGHALDDTVDKGFLSSYEKFKDVYDKCIARYEANGNKRFDSQNPDANFSTGIFDNIKYKGVNYATYNEKEAFAICMQILMGQENEFTKFIHDQMPELIDVAKELYLEIRNLPTKQRKK